MQNPPGTVGVGKEAISFAEDISASADYVIDPSRTRQVIKGLGFEIQCDSIGSGNVGMPEEPIAIPHDLVPSERERLAREMLAGFRYCRLAGGLYWRGLDPEKKFLQPRWPEQLAELKELLDISGVDGVSFEYWSPAPFWKGNASYTGRFANDPANTLRCFAPGFENDRVYRGNTDRFLADFAQAVVTDIQSLEAAGIKVSMWGLQNEPANSGTKYSYCKYNNSAEYVKTYRAVAGAVRRHDPRILLFADTDDFPEFIGPGMSDSEVASLVDAYAVHNIGEPSENVRRTHERFRRELPPRPWFQNEYEYLRGGATPRRCLNTVQHIMNSFQLCENPTWFWLHALKPLKNAEASGFALGFWKSLIDKPTTAGADKLRRWPEGPEIEDLPEALHGLEMVSANRQNGDQPPAPFVFLVNQPVTVYLLAEDIDGLELDPEWELTTMTSSWKGGRDKIYKRPFDEGTVTVPTHGGRSGARAAAAHTVFVEPSAPATFEPQIGVNEPIQIRSQTLALERMAVSIKPGHWIFNPYNWHAVGGFVKRMPWDSVGLTVEEKAYDPDARILAFKRPDGKVSVVLSNRSPAERIFHVATGVDHSEWQGFRYTPDEGGKETMGVPLGLQPGPVLRVPLPPLAWEFWEQIA